VKKLAALKVLHPEIPDVSVTAGNASGMNDWAAAVVLTSDGFTAERGLLPLATVRS
jgi:acetyl-CoA C-acetyltransferase